MIVGFTITNTNGNDEAAIDFINRVCILESKDIAKNIIKEGKGVNVFSQSVTVEELDKQPFSYTTINVVEGKHILVSAVNFNIELLYNGDVLKLQPTEYIYVDFNEVSQFKEYVEQGIVKFIPDVYEDSPWILSNGYWDDDGVWVDSDFWRD